MSDSSLSIASAMLSRDRNTHQGQLGVTLASRRKGRLCAISRRADAHSGQR